MTPEISGIKEMEAMKFVCEELNKSYRDDAPLEFGVKFQCSTVDIIRPNDIAFDLFFTVDLSLLKAPDGSYIFRDASDNRFCYKDLKIYPLSALAAAIASDRRKLVTMLHEDLRHFFNKTLDGAMGTLHGELRKKIDDENPAHKATIDAFYWNLYAWLIAANDGSQKSSPYKPYPSVRAYLENRPEWKRARARYLKSHNAGLDEKIVNQLNRSSEELGAAW